MNISFHESAEEELYESAEYYDIQQPGLGNAFLTDVDQSIDFLKTYPEASPRIYKVIRKRVLDRFPFNILYSIREDSIHILAIANQKRRPFYWRARK